MRICLVLDSSRLLRWHLWLADALAEVPGSEIYCALVPAGRSLPSSCRLLLELERLVYGSRGDGAMDDMEPALRALPPCPADEVDVVIDLTGGESLPAGRRVLTPLFNGIPSEIGVMAAVAGDQDLLIELYDTARPFRPWKARPASTDREMFAASLDGVLSCAVPLIRKALLDETHSASASDACSPKTAAPSFVGLSAVARATSGVAAKAVRLMNILAKGGKAWRIGWRFDQTASLLENREAAFQLVTGDTHSFLADPFPFPHRGQNFIFVEKYLYSQNRGCIAVLTFDRNGTVSEPRTILEEPYHLSYPFVFEQDGQIWMIPESGEAKNICLYRAVEFPYRWTREACLFEGIEGYDTTLLRHDGRFWFFVGRRVLKSASWDILSLYRADSLTGSWTPHASEPVLIDAALSRPAGAFLQHGKRTLRPVQDGSRGYGGAVTFCQIDALGESEFEQTPVGRIQAGPFGCHTYNRQAGLEVIDVFGHIRRLQEVTASYGPLALDTPAAASLGRHLSWPVPRSR